MNISAHSFNSYSFGLLNSNMIWFDFNFLLFCRFFFFTYNNKTGTFIICFNEISWFWLFFFLLLYHWSNRLFYLWNNWLIYHFYWFYYIYYWLLLYWFWFLNNHFFFFRLFFNFWSFFLSWSFFFFCSWCLFLSWSLFLWRFCLLMNNLIFLFFNNRSIFLNFRLNLNNFSWNSCFLWLYLLLLILRIHLNNIITNFVFSWSA
jgi:hypothetical protein